MNYSQEFCTNLANVLELKFSFFFLIKNEIYLLTVVDLKSLEAKARDGPSDPYAVAKWRILNRLHDRNETMYYKVSLQLFYILVCLIFLNFFKEKVNFLIEGRAYTVHRQ